MKNWVIVAVALVVAVLAFERDGPAAPGAAPGATAGRVAGSARERPAKKVPMMRLSRAGAEPEAPRTRSRKVRLKGDARGHFNVRARLNGRPVPFVVDTGASAVAINMSTARKLGLRIRRKDFTGRSSTANGVVAYAPATIREIRIGGIKVRDVRAAVLPDEALSTNLLGMTFLRRLKRFSVSNNRLLMEGRV